MGCNTPSVPKFASAEDVLDFWLIDCSEDDWFKKSDAFDAKLRDRFGATLAAAAEGRLDDWADTPDGRLALILLLDQMSRNLFRDDPRAFANDPAALALARRAIAEGDHVGVSRDRRLFLYLPFEHSESRADQEMCMALFTALGDDELLDFARRHMEIVDRFGRFPHRNETLGRESTAEEIAFLKEPGSSF